jgi:hypothetical protein
LKILKVILFIYQPHGGWSLGLLACRCYFGVCLLIYGDFIEQISGQDKLAQNNLNGVVPVPNSSNRQRPSHPVLINNLEIPNHSMRLSAPSRVSAYPANDSLGNVAYFIFLSPIVLCESLLFLFLSLFAEQVFIFLHC